MGLGGGEKVAMMEALSGGLVGFEDENGHMLRNMIER